MDRHAHHGTEKVKFHLSELVQSVSTEGRQRPQEELCLTFIVRNPLTLAREQPARTCVSA